jgi:hypothetical protein
VIADLTDTQEILRLCLWESPWLSLQIVSLLVRGCCHMEQPELKPNLQVLASLLDLDDSLGDVRRQLAYEEGPAPAFPNPTAGALLPGPVTEEAAAAAEDDPHGGNAGGLFALLRSTWAG